VSGSMREKSGMENYKIAKNFIFDKKKRILFILRIKWWVNFLIKNKSDRYDYLQKKQIIDIFFLKNF